MAWSGYDQQLPRSHAWCACTRAQAHPQVDQLVMHNANGSWSTQSEVYCRRHTSVSCDQNNIVKVCFLPQDETHAQTESELTAVSVWRKSNNSPPLHRVWQCRLVKSVHDAANNYAQTKTNQTPLLLLNSGTTRSLFATQAIKPCWKLWVKPGQH